MNKNQKRITLIIVLILLLVATGGAAHYFNNQELNQSEESMLGNENREYTLENLPQFYEFPVLGKFEGTPASINFSSDFNDQDIKMFLEEKAKEGPNFAGHFVIASWGCGTECQAFAIIDNITGDVYFPDFVSEFGQEFRVDSNLLVINPPATIKEVGDPGDWVYSAYYLWEDNQLTLLFDTRDVSVL